MHNECFAWRKCCGNIWGEKRVGVESPKLTPKVDLTKGFDHTMMIMYKLIEMGKKMSL